MNKKKRNNKIEKKKSKNLSHNDIYSIETTYEVPDIFLEELCTMCKKIVLVNYNYLKKFYDDYYETNFLEKNKEKYRQNKLEYVILLINFKFSQLFLDYKSRMNLDKVNENDFSVFSDKYLNKIIYDYCIECNTQLFQKEYIDFSKPTLCCIPFIPFCKKYIISFFKEMEYIKD